MSDDFGNPLLLHFSHVKLGAQSRSVIFLYQQSNIHYHFSLTARHAATRFELLSSALFYLLHNYTFHNRNTLNSFLGHCLRKLAIFFIFRLYPTCPSPLCQPDFHPILKPKEYHQSHLLTTVIRLLIFLLIRHRTKYHKSKS